MKCFGEYEDDLMYMKMISMKWFGQYEDPYEIGQVYGDDPCKIIWCK